MHQAFSCIFGKCSILVIWKGSKYDFVHQKLCEKLSKKDREKRITQPAITCSKLTIETWEQGVKYVQS